MNDPNRALLAGVARGLGDLRERFVFIGGCATALLLTDSAAGGVRATRDVDVVVAVSTLAEYHALGRKLEARGFTQTLASAEPPYRWRHEGTWLDVLPTDAGVLGFSNRWYGLVMDTARPCALDEGLAIRLVDAPCFIACKLEAFLDRGRGDYAANHDFEDVLTVVDGRPELAGELAGAEESMRAFIAEQIGAVITRPEFPNLLPGLIAEGTAARAAIVLERLRALAALSRRS